MIDLNNPPQFFSLTPSQYEWMVRTLKHLTLTIDTMERTIEDKERESKEVCSLYPLLRQSWKEHQKQYPQSSERFKSSIRKAYQRGIAWTLEPEDYEFLIQQECAVCQGSVGKGIGLDRINNKEGYHIDNVRPCCGPCNIARGRKPLYYDRNKVIT